MGRVATHLGKVVSHLGKVATHMGKVATHLGKVSSTCRGSPPIVEGLHDPRLPPGEGHHSMGRVATHMGRVSLYLGKVASHLGKIVSHLGRVPSPHLAWITSVPHCLPIGRDSACLQMNLGHKSSEGLGPSSGQSFCKQRSLRGATCSPGQTSPRRCISWPEEGSRAHAKSSSQLPQPLAHTTVPV